MIDINCSALDRVLKFVIVRPQRKAFLSSLKIFYCINIAFRRELVTSSVNTTSFRGFRSGVSYTFYF